MKERSSQLESALMLFEQGYGYKAVAKKLCAPKKLMKNWQYTYRAHGREAFLVRSYKQYSYETKLAVVADKVDHGLSNVELMKKYGIRTSSQIDAWTKRFREGGSEALRPRKKGRKSKPEVPVYSCEEDRLRARIQELELELEIQKRINALADEQKLR